MKSLAALIVASFVVFGTPAFAQQPDADMQKVMQQYETAWNKGDAKALAALYSRDSLRIGSDGQPLAGRAAIEQSFMKNFAADWKGTKLTTKLTRTATVTPDVRLMLGTYELTGPNDMKLRGHFLNTAVREGGQWKIASVAATPITTPGR